MHRANQPKIIYMNGPSSSGKTTLAKALQDAFEEPFLHIGIDKIIGFMPDKINNWDGGDAPIGFCWKPEIDPEGKKSYHLQAGAFAKKILHSLKTIALLLASQGYHLIIDDVAFGKVDVAKWKAALKDYSVLYTGITAPLETLQAREKTRKNRYIGSCRSQSTPIYTV